MMILCIPVLCTQEDAWKDIAEDMIEELKLFINGAREFENTDFGIELYTAYCELYDDDGIIVTWRSWSFPG
jgi:hypothetical protein